MIPENTRESSKLSQNRGVISDLRLWPTKSQSAERGYWNLICSPLYAPCKLHLPYIWAIYGVLSGYFSHIATVNRLPMKNRWSMIKDDDVLFLKLVIVQFARFNMQRGHLFEFPQFELVFPLKTSCIEDFRSSHIWLPGWVNPWTSLFYSHPFFSPCKIMI